MGWKQCVVPAREGYSSIQLAVADLHLALAAAKHEVTKGFGLFVRGFGDDTTLLLSPAAGE